MAYGDFKDLPRRTVADKDLRNKTFNITNIPRQDVYQGRTASMVYKSLNKNTSGGGVRDEIIPKQQLSEYLHKPIFRKFENRKVHF